MQRILRIFSLNVFLLFGFATFSFAGSTGIAVRAGTLGANIDLDHAYSDTIGTRVGANYFTYNYNGKKSDIDYDLDLKLKSLAVLLDWHPLHGSFRLSGGLLWNGNKIDADAKSSASYAIGNHTYTASQIGSLKGTIDFNKIAPYFGLGWDTSFGKSGLGFVFEIGAVYQGTPNVDFSVISKGLTTAEKALLQQDLSREESNFEDDIKNYKVYPVVALGISYRF